MNNEYGKGSDLFWTRRDGTFFNLDVLNDLTVGNNATVDNNLTVGNDVDITNNLDVGQEMTAAKVRGIIDVTAGAENEKEVIMSDFDIIFYHDFLSSRAEISRSTENSPGNTGSDNDLLFRAQKGFWFRPNFNGNAPSITHAEVALHVHIEEEFAVREGAFKVGRDGVLRWPRILDEIPDVADLDLGDIWLAAAEGGLLPDVILAVNKVEEIPTIQMIPFLDLPATPGGPYILNHGIHIVGTLTLTGDFEHEGDLTVTSGAIKGPQIEATGSAANAFYSASGGVTLDAGDILLSTGSLTITSGSISAGGTVTGDRIIASSSAANAFYSADGGLTLDNGDISVGGQVEISSSIIPALRLSGTSGLVIDNGSISLSLGGLTATQGEISAKSLRGNDFVGFGEQSADPSGIIAGRLFFKDDAFDGPAPGFQYSESGSVTRTLARKGDFIELFNGATLYSILARSNGLTLGTATADDDMYLGTVGGFVMQSDTNDNGISGNKCLQIFYRTNPIMEVDLRGFLRIPLTSSAVSGVSEGAFTGNDGTITNSGLACPMYYTPETGELEDLPLYTQGTWTPVLGDNAGGTFTMTSTHGRWIRIGNLFYLECRASWTDWGTALAANSLELRGLPVQVQTSPHGKIVCTRFDNAGVFERPIIVIPGAGTTWAFTDYLGVGLHVKDADDTATQFLHFSGTVFASSSQWPTF